jgi:hypothetical protein
MPVYFLCGLYRTMLYLCVCAFVCAAGTLSTGHRACAQTTDFSIGGSVVVSTNQYNAFLNFGGPGLTFDWKQSNLRIVIGVLPSVRINFRELDGPFIDKYQISTALGFGPQVHIGKFIIATPMYVLGRNLHVTAGLGYRF